MPSQVIQWFPGHMAKTRRLIVDNLKNVDCIIEILDARIPYSSRNPEIRKLVGDKPKLILLNKSVLADPIQNKIWSEKLIDESSSVLLTDCTTGYGLNKIEIAVKSLLSDKLKRYEEKGMSGRRIRAMVLGIPNVGKSSFINKVSGGKKARVENRPGVTTSLQWVPTSVGIDLLDMPGILWPKFEEKRVGENLALTGAIKDQIIDMTELAAMLCKRLRLLYPGELASRYRLSVDGNFAGASDYELLRQIGKNRALFVRGGEVDEDRTALMMVKEFRDGKIAKITLDRFAKEELHA